MQPAETRSPPRCHAGDKSVSQNASNATEYNSLDWRVQRLVHRFGLSASYAALVLTLALASGRAQ